jgi:hypothetical protein
MIKTPQKRATAQKSAVADSAIGHHILTIPIGNVKLTILAFSNTFIAPVSGQLSMVNCKTSAIDH